MKYIPYVIIYWLQIIVILCYIPRAIPSFIPFFSRKVIIERPFAFVGIPKVLFDTMAMVMISTKYFVINESRIFGTDVFVRDVFNSARISAQTWNLFLNGYQKRYIPDVLWIMIMIKNLFVNYILISLHIT